MAHEHIVYMMLVDAAARAEDVAGIQKYAPRLEELAVRDDHKPYLAVVQRAWGIAHRIRGEYEEADARLQTALAIFEELESSWQIGRTLFELGESALAQTDGAAAHSYFILAQTRFEELGAQPDIARTAVILEDLN
jgi:tetratricopeptide (TPR) repeat protein